MKLWQKLCAALTAALTVCSVLMAGCGGQTAPAADNSWLSGITAPEAGWGVDGDIYIDTDDGDLYRKRDGQWNLIANIRGPAGGDGQSVTGADGVGVQSAGIVDGELVFYMTDGTSLNVGSITAGTEYDLSVLDGKLTVIASKTYADLDAEAYGGLSFRQIFMESNILSSGNYLDDATSDGWTVGAGAPTADESKFATAPSSLCVTGDGSQQLRFRLTAADGGRLFLASQVNVQDYTAGYVGAYILTGGSNIRDGMKGARTDGWETAAQIFDYSDTSKTASVVVGSGGTATMTAWTDSVVVINLTKLFGEDAPDLAVMRRLYDAFVRLYGGEKNVTVSESYQSDNNYGVYDEQLYSKQRRAFFDKMVLKAQSLGIDIDFDDVNSAIAQNNYIVTVQDMVKLAIHATGYEEMQKIWSQHHYSTVSENNERSFTVDSYVHSRPYSHYLSDYYFVLGGKTGSLSANASRPATTCIYVAVEGPDGAIFVGGVSKDAVSTEEDNHFRQLKVLFDIATQKYYDRDADTSELESQLTADRACVVVLPQNGNILSYGQYDWFGPDSPYHLFSRNGTEKIMTASSWKMLTVMTALDYVSDLNRKAVVLPEDINASTPSFSGGEVLTIRDLLHFIMLPSSNTSCNVVARTVGAMILDKQL